MDELKHSNKFVNSNIIILSFNKLQYTNYTTRTKRNLAITVGVLAAITGALTGTIATRTYKMQQLHIIQIALTQTHQIITLITTART